MTISVSGFTAERSQEIEDQAIIGGSVDGSGDLILERNNGGTVNAGSVVGPTGPAGSGLIICTSGTRPSPDEGMMIWETDTNRIYVYGGSNWRWIWSANGENKVDVEVGVTGDVDSSGTTYPPTLTVDVDIPTWAKKFWAHALLGQARQVTGTGNTELELLIGSRVITHKRNRWAVSDANHKEDLVLMGSCDVEDLAGSTLAFRVKATVLSGTGALRLEDESLCYIRGEFTDP